ncbi:DUF2806 domain-containing protein [Pseudochrobactrum sp. XF203]|uniref:DUF2806 domain-containing protein n=1 Tax=Pseudochrobactrum sp. XF203 TaxID=2879116 RepID=UPI001CE24572|nr:DUF2806 domain-containing protein [Pseudochrobactrum sp. XF203]UCA47036.1 DUF2806 domain-containing protein [Pseudochrobactrum sp. XF203]
MEKEDHLDKETAVSFDLTETGGSIKAKSRLISAIDRLGGSLVEIISFPAERRVQRNRIELDTEKEVMEAAAKKLVEAIKTDDAIANRVLEARFKKDVRKQLNKDGVIAYALDDLRNISPEVSETAEAPEELGEEFLERFEHYAEDASTDDLRQRWGRILAGEIRKPGTFNRKVLRAVDEIDSRTAKLFEGLAEGGLGNVLFKSLIRHTTYNERILLHSSGILTVVSDDQHRFFVDMTLNSGERVWFFGLYDYAIAFSVDIEPNYEDKDIILKYENTPCLPIFLLTDVGEALLNIIIRNEIDIVRNLAEKVNSVLPENSLMYFVKNKNNNLFFRVRNFNNL